MSLDAMKQALEALELLARYENPATKIQVRKPRDGGSIVTMYPHKVASEAATALRAAIEQAQEPVAWMNPSWIDSDTRGWASDSFESIEIEGWIPLYTAPRQWQGLTDAEIKAPIQRAMQYFGYDPTQYSLGGAATIGFYGLAKEIEAKLKEKNT